MRDSTEIENSWLRLPAPYAAALNRIPTFNFKAGAIFGWYRTLLGSEELRTILLACEYNRLAEALNIDRRGATDRDEYLRGVDALRRAVAIPDLNYDHAFSVSFASYVLPELIDRRRSSEPGRQEYVVAQLHERMSRLYMSLPAASTLLSAVETVVSTPLRDPVGNSFVEAAGRMVGIYRMVTGEIA
jgi:hypothetical protein